MCCKQIKAIEKIEKLMIESGLTITQLVNEYGKTNSALLNMSQKDQNHFMEIYDEISSNYNDAKINGQKLEELTALLFDNSAGSFFECRKNCRTSSNEIDLLVTWNERARLNNIPSAFSCFGDTFMCECKKYNGKVNVTYVGKFYSLLSLNNIRLGILVAWDGVTGKGQWDAAKGLIKKIALKESIFILVIDKDDLKEIYDCKRHIYSLILDKYNALKNDIEFEKYVSKHPAENKFNLKD